MQALHSIEEYLARLYEVFPPATFVGGLLSSNLQLGFVEFNAALVLFGVWCFPWPIRRRWPSTAIFAWFWVAMELVNGIGNPVCSLRELAYTPGVATAPMLLIVALYMAWQLRAPANAH